MSLDIAADILTDADWPADRDSAARFLRRFKDSDEPRGLVEPLCAPDLLLLLREADDEQRGELLAICSQEQFDGMADLSCWRGDVPDYQSLEAFLSPLVMKGLDEAQLAIERLSEELRTLLLRRHVIVHLREDKDDDIPADDDNEVIVCADSLYFIELVSEDGCPEVIRGLIQGLLAFPFDYYQKELECIRHDFPTELEEMAYRWRNNRLADSGFGTREEGLALLSPVDPSKVMADIRRGQSLPLLPVDVPVPALYQKHYKGALLLHEAVALLNHSSNPDHRRRAAVLPAEFAAMTNLLLGATDCDLADLDDLGIGIGLSRDLLCLGLSAVECERPSAAAAALLVVLPGTLVQAAMGVLVPLRERARALLRNRALLIGKERCAWLDPPHRMAVLLLARDIPLWWSWLDGPGRLADVMQTPSRKEMMSFSSLKQVAMADQLLVEAEQVEEMTERMKGVNDWANDVEGEMSFCSTALTVLANAFSEEGVQSLPVTEEIAESFAEAFINAEEETVIFDAMAVLAPIFGVDVDGTLMPDEEPDTARRLLLRTLHIGRARLLSLPVTSLLPIRA